ncbi:MAG: ABC transporter permease [Microgenomates group bacterium]|nr:ABC transporter permease [Microgenomates group bacterium]
MNYFYFILKTSLDDFKRNKLRTFLTSLGIFIGILSIILLNSLGLGLKQYLNNQFESLGANLLYIYPGSKKSIVRGGGLVGGIKFDARDFNQIEKINEVSEISPIIGKTGALAEVKGKEEIIDLLGANEKISKLFNLELEKGRLIEKRDCNKKSKVVMISSVLAKKLFGNTDVINETITIDGNSYKIIAVLKAKGGGGLGSDLDTHVYAPLSTLSLIYGEKKYPFIYLKVKNKENIDSTKEKITAILKKKYDENSFSVLDQKETMSMLDSIFNVLNFVLVGIASISLVVGGVGIMNIMYVSVTERTKEIGIRRAFGARKKDVLWLFLAESLFMCFASGILALIFAYLINMGIHYFLPSYIDFLTILMAIGTCSFIGIIFGVLPAKKAAELEPVEAIRYE